MNPIKSHLLDRLRPKDRTMTTMTDEEATVLGSRAVNAGLRIVPGMKTIHARGKWSSGIITGFDYDGSPAISTGLNPPFSPPNLLPDLRDPGTKGHAVAQLREMTGDAHLVMLAQPESGEPVEHAIGYDPNEVTEEEAIVIALEMQE